MKNYENYALGSWIKGDGEGTPLYNAINGQQIGTASSKGLDFSQMMSYAKEKGGYESIFFKGNKITEAAHSNVWIIKRNKIITHPANKRILKGVTRTVLLNLIKKLGYSVNEREFSIKELYKSDEVFITSSGSFVTPILKIDQIIINNGKIGPITKSLALSFYNAII